MGLKLSRSPVTDSKEAICSSRVWQNGFLNELAMLCTSLLKVDGRWLWLRLITLPAVLDVPQNCTSGGPWGTISPLTLFFLNRYANYGLQYWLTFVVTHHVNLGHDTDLVRAVFWLLLSKHSSVPQSTRASYLAGADIPPDVRQRYSDATCPFAITTRRR